MELDIFVNDILNLFQDYKIEKHTDDENGYEFLDVGHYFLTIKPRRSKRSLIFFKFHIISIDKVGKLCYNMTTKRKEISK